MNSPHSSRSLSALCFLTLQPSFETIQFALEIAQNISSIDVFIAVDDNTVTYLPTSSSTIQFIQLNEIVCIKHGFQQANIFGTRKACSAWDKAIYYFTKLSTHHSFVWFVEEDVFIPSVQAFLALHELYSFSHDLITANVTYNLNGDLTTWFHSSSVLGIFILPWARSMVCAMGCSRRLLLAVDEYVQWRGQLAFIEVFFHTLALQNGRMKVVTPFELDTIVYREDYTFAQIQERPNNWWHPIKDFDQRIEWRNWLRNNPSIDQDNIRFTLNSIENQLNDNNVTKSIYDIESQMKNLLVLFEIVKGQLKTSIRLQLRDRFLRFVDKNLTDNLKFTAQLLADHAFKLPNPSGDNMMKIKKTAIHMELEKAIENTKQMILRLIKNDTPTIHEIMLTSRLRQETKQLIRRLTFKMRREQQVILWNQTIECKFMCI